MPIHTHSNRIEEVDPLDLQNFTGVPYVPYLEFDHLHILRQCCCRQRLAPDRLWLSVYFRNEIFQHRLPKVSLRWIDDAIGWGVFAEKDFSPMEFIAEYTGLVRKRSKNDSKNAYCFEYLLDPGEETPYLIDAEHQGGISRYINHKSDPNLSSAFTRIDGIPHVILYTAKPIPKGAELFYDYGPDYWKRRAAPR